MNKNLKRAGLGACTAAALVVGAGLAFAPAANADTPTSLVGGLTTGVTGIVSGVLGGSTTTSTPTVSTGTDGLTVGLGSTTVGVTTGNGVGVTVGTGNSSGVAVQLGGTTSGVVGTVGVSGGSTTTTTTTPTGTPTTTTTTTTGSTTDSTTPATLSALSVTSQYTTVYPAKDGYQDTDNFTLNGTTSDGLQHAASGTATLKFGSAVVKTWAITATNQVINWDGLKAGKLVPGSYTMTAAISDSAGHTISGTDKVAVSAKKRTAGSTTVTSKSVSGTHKLSAKALAAFAHGKVYVKVTANKVTGVHGKQYLVLKHGTKKIKVLIKNGTHTSKYVSIPKTFKTFTVSHTWKKGTVKVKSFKYHYKYKVLK